LEGIRALHTISRPKRLIFCRETYKGVGKQNFGRPHPEKGSSVRLKTIRSKTTNRLQKQEVKLKKTSGSTGVIESTNKAVHGEKPSLTKETKSVLKSGVLNYGRGQRRLQTVCKPSKSTAIHILQKRNKKKQNSRRPKQVGRPFPSNRTKERSRQQNLLGARTKRRTE